jgi:hypothetical protein
VGEKKKEEGSRGGALAQQMTSGDQISIKNCE